MKKKLVSALMCATMAVTMLAGCGNGSKNGTEAADGGTETYFILIIFPEVFEF